MEKLPIRVLYIVILFILGCGAQEKPIFDLPGNPNGTPSQSNSAIQLFIRDQAAPADTDTSFTLNESELPDSSIFFSFSQINPSSSNFLLNLKVKNLNSVYDMPLVLTYDPNVLTVNFDTPSTTLTEGPLTSRLRKTIDRSKVSILGAPDPRNAGRFLITQSLLISFGNTVQTYNGVMISIPFRALVSGSFKSTVGFDLASSRALGQDGTDLNARFFAATLSKE